MSILTDEEVLALIAKDDARIAAEHAAAGTTLEGEDAREARLMARAR